VQFLVRDKGFSEERVRSGVARLKKHRGQSVQGRLDSFFKPIPKPEGATAKPSAAKRKVRTQIVLRYLIFLVG
jgi:flap endonuclease-1